MRISLSLIILIFMCSLSQGGEVILSPKAETFTAIFKAYLHASYESSAVIQSSAESAVESFVTSTNNHSLEEDLATLDEVKQEIGDYVLQHPQDQSARFKVKLFFDALVEKQRAMKTDRWWTGISTTLGITIGGAAGSMIIHDPTYFTVTQFISWFVGVGLAGFYAVDRNEIIKVAKEMSKLFSQCHFVMTTLTSGNLAPVGKDSL